MIHIRPALAGLALSFALVSAMPLQAAPKPAATKARHQQPKRPAQAPQPPRELSASAARVTSWIAASGDNRALPYIVIDKPAAAAFLFDAKGEPLADGPVLIGLALGDEATPGIGGKSLDKIGPAEKTTPAGRFLARFGKAAGGVKVLWVDYATSVALHTIPPASTEQRRKRMLSPSIEDNRVTYGCINVPKAFYARVQPLFGKKGGYVYILPDSKPLEAVFPLVLTLPTPSAAPVL